MTTFTLKQDLEDAFVWDSIQTERDDSGVIVSRGTIFDNGLTKAEYFSEGVLRHVLQTDLQDNGAQSDLKPWQTIETFYDAQGVIEARFELRDTGITILRQYEDGTLRQKVQTDLAEDGSPSDAKVWERIEEYFDDQGQREFRFEVRDDGVTILNQYEDGALRSTVATDLQNDGSASDARNWERIETYYDAEGQREARFELKDNGVTIFNEYQDGVRRVTTQEDRDAFGNTSLEKPWESITAFYDDQGQIEARETIFDNGDVTAFFYEDGTKSLRLQYDGDNSASWLVRETVYDADAQVAVINTYDTPEDVPPEYGFFDLA